MAESDYFCPAKLNLCLAVTGRRGDGFHDLVSVVALLEHGDTLRVSAADETTLECDDPAVPLDDRNLVLKAAQAFRRASGWTGGARFRLTKRIPMGAGLGGGSSDAATALVALNQVAGHPLSPPELSRVAAEVGSDCAVFLAGGPAVMRGRGEQVTPLTEAAARGLRGRGVLVFKPEFGIATPWAYRRLAEQAAAGVPGAYRPAADAEAAVAAAVRAAEQGAPLEAHLFNALEHPAFEKFLALPALLARLRSRFGLAPRMSGSGSACFAFLAPDAPLDRITAEIRDAWGPSAWIAATACR